MSTERSEGLEYKPGDTITLEHPDGSRLVGVVGPADSEELDVPTLQDTTFDLPELLELGWTITNVTSAALALPTEPGAYQDAGGYLTIRTQDGRWLGTYGDLIELKLADLPLTRLVPEGGEREAAIREVIEYLGMEISASTASDMLKDLGVTP